MWSCAAWVRPPRFNSSWSLPRRQWMVTNVFVSENDSENTDNNAFVSENDSENTDNNVLSVEMAV